MKKYEICTLVTDFEQYSLMKESFIKNGFVNSKFTYIDNSKKNIMDAYSAVNFFVKNSDCDYLIICHQDILLNDDINKLNLVIDELNKLDEKWIVAGNAGGDDNLDRLYLHINDPYTNVKMSNLPKKVLSLDENFLIINMKYPIGCSIDLSGFHFYGTDLCLQALIKGGNCYVIDFYLTHLGKGKIDKDFYRCKNNLIKKYSSYLRGTFIRTTCSKIYISNNKYKNIIFNNSFVLKFITLLHRMSSNE